MGRDSCRVAGLQCKEVLNNCDGARLGFVGEVVALVIPPPWSLRCLFRPGDEQVVLWEDVERVGDDIILVRRTKPRPKPRRNLFG